LRGKGQGTVKAVRGLDEMREALGNLVVEAKIPKPGQPKSDSYEGEGYVIVRHTDTRIVERAVQQLADRVVVELG
jgi:hypothetical protein